MENIVDRIIAFCEHLNMSVSSFASSIGINQVTLNNYKLGKRKPSLELVEKVAKTYPQVSTDWLIRGVGSMMCCGEDETLWNGSTNTVQGENNIVGNNLVGSDAVLAKENEMLRKQLEDKDKEIEFLRNIVNNK